MKPRGRAVPPPRTTAEIEAEIARGTAALSRQAEAHARAAAIDAALAQNDAAPIRAWARAWLPDTSTIDAADDASLLESARAAQAARADPTSPVGLAGVEEAAQAVARQVAALPSAHAREQLLTALEESPTTDALTRHLNRLIAAQARRLLNAPKVNAP